MIRIAVCDDEKYFREKIGALLQEYSSAREFGINVESFASGEEFLASEKKEMFDVIFLDINMDELDGMETAQKIQDVSNDIFIVFVTAFVNYAIEGYRVDAVRYILKNNVNFSELVFECMDAITMKMNYVVKKKTFNFNEGTKNVSLERLLYIESRLHKLEFYIMEDQLNKYSLYGTLNDMEAELADNNFVRIHQSYLVNMKHIAKVSRYEVLLSNGIKLEIPKVRYKFVEETFVSYKGEI